MKRFLGKKELEDIVWGATLLGAGGGGSPQEGLNLIKDMEKKVELFDPEDLPERANAVMVAGIGSPKAFSEKGFGPEAISAYEAIKKVASIGGVDISYLMPGEIGGFNVITPLYVASKENVPVVDADGNGRAVPELSTGLYPIYKIPTSPLVVANKEGDVLIAYLKKPFDSASAERIARSLAVSFEMIAAFATWIVSIETIKRCLVPKSISRSEEIGSIIRKSKESGKNVAKEVENITGGKEIFRGEIKKIEMKTAEGFDFGRTTLEGIENYQNSTLNIDFKNENIIAWKDRRPFIMVPDLIAMMEIEGKPLTNADTKEGMEIVVMVIPAPEPWKRIPEGFNCWKPILEKLGYKGSYISL
ncbi:MAG: DUF917 domain-containing protein [Candidatus Aerophobetes bacterium]|nr:DUF917 domain-containing protein [Candidatus Aerophobetes bacterium]